MKIAGDITIILGDEEFLLLPRLRHAMNLARRQGGFKVLVRELLDQSITAAIECLRPHCDLSDEYLAELLLSSNLNEVQFKLLDYVMQLSAIDPDAEQKDAPKPAKQGEQQSYEEFFLQLYRWGTGWLGWTPAQTLESTPFEIIEAHQGRVQMLRAIYGSSEPDTKDSRSIEDKFRSVFTTFGTIPQEAA